MPTTMRFALLLLAIAVAACGESGDENSQTNSANTNNTNSASSVNNTTGSNNGGAVTFTDDVFPIINANCAKAAPTCHLSPGNGTSFVIGEPVTPDSVQAAIDGVQTGAMVALVVGGDLDNSEIYLRITGTQGRAKMPFRGELAAADVETITRWIEGGAKFD